MSPLIRRSPESLADPVIEPEARPVEMPPWPWEDERFAVPENLTTIAEFVAWAQRAYIDYPEYLYALLHPALPHTYVVED